MIRAITEFVLLTCISALVALLFIACSSPYHAGRPKPRQTPPGECGRTFLVAPEFTADEKEEILRAVDRWNDVSIETFCLAYSKKPGEAETTDRGIYRIPYKGEAWQAISKMFNGENVLGVYWGASDQIGIVDGMAIETFYLVALHEFGHAHGLDHTACPAIMCPYVGTADDFAPNDMAECQRVGACARPSDAGVDGSGEVRPLEVGGVL